MLLPAGYTARPVAMIDPGGISSGVSYLESVYPGTGTMFALRIDLSSGPSDIEAAAQALSDCLKGYGVQSWLSEPAYADPVYPVIWVGWVHSSTAPAALESFVTTSAWWAILAPIMIGIVAFLILPGVSELVETIITFAMMYMMMYVMMTMMSSMYPELKPAKEKMRVPISKASEYIRKYGPGAYERLKTLSARGAKLAPPAMAELERLAGAGVNWAQDAWRRYKSR